MFAATVLAALTVTTVIILPGQRTSLWVSLVGTFWGFGLAQGGTISYDRARQRDELAAMFVSARFELQMNKGLVVWIDHLLDHDLAEEDIHGMGFAGLDQFSVRAIENLVTSPLTYRFTSDDFSSHYLLSIYQTILSYQREIPTDRVDGKDKARYGKIAFDKVIASFETLTGWLETEAERVFGVERWRARISAAVAAQERRYVTSPSTDTSPPATGRTATPGARPDSDAINFRPTSR